MGSCAALHTLPTWHAPTRRHCSCGWEAACPGGAAGAPGAAPAEQTAAAVGAPPPLRFQLSTVGPGRLLTYASAAPSAVEAAGGVRFSYNEATGALTADVPHGMHRTDWTLAF